MASCSYLLFFLIHVLLLQTLAYNSPAQINRIYPFNCSNRMKSCTALLYQHNSLTPEKISSYYSVNLSQIKPISYRNRQDYIVSVPCSCNDVNGTVGYFYNTVYNLQPNDTFSNVSTMIYSGQAWKVGGEEEHYTAGDNVTMHLLCGCVETDTQIVVTYTVQYSDTLSSISDLLSAQVDGIESLNTYLAPNPGYVDIGWLLYVPKELQDLSSLPPPSPASVSVPEKKDSHKKHHWTIIVGILSIVTVVSVCTLLIFLFRRKKSKGNNQEDPRAFSKTVSANRSYSLQKQYQNTENLEGDMPSNIKRETFVVL